MINNPSYFEKHKPAGYDGQFHWDFLLSAFDSHVTKIRPMDFDCVVERRGRFIVYETKHPGSVLPKGQRRTLETLLTMKCWTAVFVEGKHPRELRLFIARHLDQRFEFSSDDPAVVTAALVRYSAAWFKAANNGLWTPDSSELQAISGRHDMRAAVRDAADRRLMPVPMPDTPAESRHQKTFREIVGDQAADELRRQWAALVKSNT